MGCLSAGRIKTSGSEPDLSGRQIPADSRNDQGLCGGISGPASDEGSTANMADLLAACTDHLEHRLGRDAVRIEAKYRWEDLILPNRRKSFWQMHATRCCFIIRSTIGGDLTRSWPTEKECP